MTLISRLRDFLIIFIFILITPVANSSIFQTSLYESMGVLAEKLSNSLDNVGNRKTKFVLTGLENENFLPNEVRNYFLNHLMAQNVLDPTKPIVIPCHECLVKQGESIQGDLFPAPTGPSSYRKTVLKYQARHRIHTRLSQSSKRIILDYTTYDVKSGRKITEGSLSTKVMDIEEHQMSVSLGVGKIMGHTFGARIHFLDRIPGWGWLGGTIALLNYPTEPKNVFVLAPTFGLSLDEVFSPLLSWGDIFLTFRLGLGVTSANMNIIGGLELSHQILNYWEVFISANTGLSTFKNNADETKNEVPAASLSLLIGGAFVF
jgi:hypothetical protein